MTLHLPTRGALCRAVAAIGTGAILALPVVLAVQEPPDAGAQAGRLEALKTAGPKAALALYPVRVLGKPDANVAMALGMILESFGMDQLDVPQAAFDAPADATWEQTPAKFAEFLKQNKPASAYTLYAEFVGEPKGGPKEVRFIVTDAEGKLVLTDRQTPADGDFKRTAARDPDPMGCSLCVAERLFRLTGWKKQERSLGSESKFARYFAEQAGTPAEAEVKAMKPRVEKLKAGLKSANVAVYATLVGDAGDAASAGRLAKLIAPKFGCRASAVDTPTGITVKPARNEQKLLWDLAKAFREYVRANPPAADYAVLGQFFVNSKGGPAGAVHFVLCEKSGDWVIVDFQNNQHDDFQRIAPKSVEDCEKLALERLAGYLK